MIPLEPSQPPSLIETMRLEAGIGLPLLDGHLRRLRRSSEALGYPWPGEAELREKIRQATSTLECTKSWRIRLLMSEQGRISLETSPISAVQAPLKVVLHGPRAGHTSPWLLHKTTHRPWYEEANQWLAAHPDVFDVLFWNEDGFMSEGSRSNLYVQSAGGTWLTPPLEAGVLPGVQREFLLEAGSVQEAPIHRDDLKGARALRISNALRGWVNVLCLDIAIAAMQDPVRGLIGGSQTHTGGNHHN